MSKPNLPPFPPLEGDDPANFFCDVVSVDAAMTYARSFAEEAVRQALAAQLPVADERAAFEAFQRGAGLDELYFERHPESGQYMWTATKEAWETWQARAALSFKPETRDG